MYIFSLVHFFFFFISRVDTIKLSQGRNTLFIPFNDFFHGLSAPVTASTSHFFSCTPPHPPPYPATACWNITRLLIPITAVSLSHYSDRYREASAASCFQFFFFPPYCFFFFSPRFFKLDFWFWGRSTAQELKRVSLSGEISAAWGEKLPRDHSTFAASWLRDETGQNKETDSGKTHAYIMKLMINSDD